MPTYEYQCEKCGKEQVVFHKMSEKNTESCKHCGAGAEYLKRILSATPGYVK